MAWESHQGDVGWMAWRHPWFVGYSGCINPLYMWHENSSLSIHQMPWVPGILALNKIVMTKFFLNVLTLACFNSSSAKSTRFLRKVISLLVLNSFSSKVQILFLMLCCIACSKYNIKTNFNILVTFFCLIRNQLKFIAVLLLCEFSLKQNDKPQQVFHTYDITESDN